MRECIDPSTVLTKWFVALVLFRPVLISSYTNAMNLIAQEAERRAIRIPGLRAIQGTSEPLPPIVRERLSCVFGCEVYDKYGSRETNVVSHECPAHEQNHIQVENVFVEFVDEHGEHVRPGVTGRLILTTFNNLSMPLLRYETSDLAAPIDEPCGCAFACRACRALRGGSRTLIQTPNGDHIDAYLFSYLIMRFLSAPF